MKWGSKEWCVSQKDPVMSFVSRRKWLSGFHPACPICNESHQIQLVDWIGRPIAQWQCRKCHHIFNLEPT